MQSVLASKGLVAYVLGSALYFRCPFPARDLALQLIALRQPLIYEGLRYSYTLFPFATILPTLSFGQVSTSLRLVVHASAKQWSFPSTPMSASVTAGTCYWGEFT